MEVKKAEGLVDWLDQRLAIRKLIEVMMTKYWIPKNINWLWAMGVVLTDTLFLACCDWILPFDVL